VKYVRLGPESEFHGFARRVSPPRKSLIFLNREARLLPIVY
jgi:hypothetical protein